MYCCAVRIMLCSSVVASTWAANSRSAAVAIWHGMFGSRIHERIPDAVQISTAAAAMAARALPPWTLRRQKSAMRSAHPR